MSLSARVLTRPLRLRQPAARLASIRTITTTKAPQSDPPTSTPTSEAPAPTPTTPIRTPLRTPTRATPRPLAARPRKPSPSRFPTRAPPPSEPAERAAVDWAQSYHGVSSAPFPPEVGKILHKPLDPEDVEIKPDGIVFLPEIKYRNILFEAFGPGGWGMVPRGEPEVLQKMVTREWALMVHGRFISQSRGENNYFGEDQIPRAIEACKSNALMRCCKDLGIAAELWDKRFVRAFKEEHAHEVWVEHVVTKKKAKIWLKREDKIEYPFKVGGTMAPKKPASG